MGNNLDPISIKYFKLVVDPASIKKDKPDEVQANCPVCGDRKHRLHLYRPKGFDQDVVHDFNEGCELAEKHHNIFNFLKIAGPEYLDDYKRETMFKTVERIKEKSSGSSGETETGPKLQDIINKVTGIKDQELRKPKKELPLHRLFMKCADSKECTDYVMGRGFEPRPDWFYSEDKFFTYNGKKVFLENYLIIPIYQNGLYKGFYSRSIKEKSFSTFLLPDTEKIWVSDPEVDVENIEIICEGVFDALSTGFERSGAMLSASLSPLYLKELKENKDVIIALDNDETGREKSLWYAENGFRVFVPPEDYFYKDFNEAMLRGWLKSEIKNLIQKNTYQGYDAIVRIKMKG